MVTKMQKKDFEWKYTTGYTIDTRTGMARRCEDAACTLHFYHAFPKDRLWLTEDAYEYMVLEYESKVEDKYIYSYSYQPEESWTVYREDPQKSFYTKEPFVFERECYFRLNIRKLSEADYKDEIPVKWERAEGVQNISEKLENISGQEIFQNEIEDTITKGRKQVGEKDIAFITISDTHYTINGTWNNTHHLNTPLYYVIGNHDYNYFHQNPEPFSKKEMLGLYFKENEEQKELYYYRDFEKQQLRIFFLESFSPKETIRYGFPEEELDWLEKMLTKLPANWYVLLFSHVPPTARLHYWSSNIRGSRRLLQMLRFFQSRTKGKLLGFIHGHNHTDAVDYQEGFPIISIGCGKCEYYPGKKPAGAKAFPRCLDSVSQELWDIMIVSTEKRTIDFIRFGAGEDRHIDCNILQYGQGEQKPMKKVITYGTFDLFHEGHYNLLKRAKELGDYLIVGVTTEHFDEQRGKVNVIDSLLDRIDNVRKTGLADEIIIEDHEGQKIEDIQKYQVDIFTEGSDWRGTFDYLKAFCEVVYLERTPDISSTMLRKEKFPIVRLGIVGTGRIAPRFIAEAKYVSGLNIQSAYNPHKDSVKKFADKMEIEGYSGVFEEFLDTVDAIYIATPHETHYDYAKRALQKGKHVLCEKPIALCKKDTEELFALAKEKKAVLMEGIKTAYCPGFLQILNIAKSGKIGEIRDVEACFSRLTNEQLREMTDFKYGGAFLEFGSYTLLPIIKLLGIDYKKVQINSILAENGVDLYTKLQVCYDNGLAMSKTGIGVKSEGQLLIAGTKGYILAESPWWLTRKFQVRYEDPTKVETYTPNFIGDGLRYEISEFISKINGYGGCTYKLTAEESIAMADIVEQFMEERKKMRQELQEKNKLAGIGIWAHRGCSFQYPENTLPAFQAACEIEGLSGIELDIQLSKDGELVVFHDETVDRLMNGKGKISDYTVKELSQMQFKDWNYEEKDAQEMHIPTMESVLKLVKPYAVNNGLKINIELKNSKTAYEGMEGKILSLVDKYDMKPYIVYSSFHADSIKLLKTLEPEAETGILASNASECVAKQEGIGANAIHPNVDGIDLENVENFKIPVRVWNTKEPFFGQDKYPMLFDLNKLRKKGITDIITNVPENYLA